MNGLLVRVGIDSTCGEWNAPVRLSTGEFAYVPIPEGKDTRPDLQRTYEEFEGPVRSFDCDLPEHLRGKSCHLDPDFATLTFGDQGSRGGQIASLGTGDFMAFFASLRPVDAEPACLVYALIGFFVVESIKYARDIPRNEWGANAHTRRLDPADSVVAQATPGVSGRLQRCLPIGEFRNRAYRVTQRLLDDWGGLDIQGGYIQRSVHLPRFNDAQRFYSWFMRHSPAVIAANN